MPKDNCDCEETPLSMILLKFFKITIVARNPKPIKENTGRLKKS
ncbi:13768_t:CDS:1, partial [Dentiscutata erythropus]